MLFIGVCFLLSVAENSVRPILRTMALANVEIIAGEKISEAIEEEMVSEDYELESIISFEKDAEGRINAVKTNIVTANRLKSALSLAVLDKIGQITESDVAVPSGSLTGLALLSGRGPNIPVKTIPVGSVRGSFRSHAENVFQRNTGLHHVLHQDVHRGHTTYKLLCF
ncbi:MAG: hypothetical protein IJB44_09160, partial [Clostridia bacterium]|nr:hypothetical protein [Clostridia bacterium]